MDYKIAVCDDEAAEARYIASAVRDWADSEKVCADIRVFCSAESFLFDCAQSGGYDILLLDIEMPRMNGMELARRLRRTDDALQIVFITGYPDFIAEGYEVAALHYLMKPVSADRLAQVLRRAAAKLGKAEKTLIFVSDGQSIKVAAREVVSAEAFAHTCVLCTVGARYELKKSITEVERALNEADADAFVRCHRSYIVGLRHINKLSKTDIILDGGAAVPVARSRRDAVNRAFIRCFKGDLTWD